MTHAANDNAQATATDSADIAITTIRPGLSDAIRSLELAVRTLCWLSEECERNVAVLRQIANMNGTETFADLVGEQAYQVRTMIEAIARDIAAAERAA